MPRRLDSPAVLQVSAVGFVPFFEWRWNSCWRVSITNMPMRGRDVVFGRYEGIRKADCRFSTLLSA